MNKKEPNFLKLLASITKYVCRQPLQARLAFNLTRTSDMHENMNNPIYIALPKKIKRRDGKWHDMKKGPCCCGKVHQPTKSK